MFWNTTLYIRISPSEIRILNPETGREFRELPILVVKSSPDGEREVVGVGREAELGHAGPVEHINPFDHERLVLDGFEEAVAVLLYGCARIAGKWAWIRPRMLIQPMREFDGGLGQIERRALIELGESAGARMVAIHTGRKLSVEEILNYQFAKEEVLNYQFTKIEDTSPKF